MWSNSLMSLKMMCGLCEAEKWVLLVGLLKLDRISSKACENTDG